MRRGRRKLLPRVAHDCVLHRLESVADELANIGDVIGSVYGAAWCNKALKLYRNVHRLRQEVIDHYDDLLSRQGARTSLRLTRDQPKAFRQVGQW
jgi:hypothetical protein